MKEKNVKKTNDYVTNRVLITFAVAAFYLWGLNFLYNVLDNMMTYQTGRGVALGIAAVSAAGVVVSLISYAISVKKGTYRKDSVFNGLLIALYLFVLCVCTLMLWYNYLLSMRLIYVIIPVAAILYLICSVYQKTFCTICVTHAIVAFSLYLMSKTTDPVDRNIHIAIFIVGLAACVVGLILFFATKNNGGRLRILGVEFQLFSRGTDARYIAGLYIATMLLLIAAFALGARLALYAAIAVAVLLLCGVVYCTVKLM